MLLTMMRALLLALPIGCVCATANAAEAVAESASVRLEPYTEQHYYPWLTDLSRGPVEWPPGSDDDGHAFRVAHMSAEAYDTVLIEQVTLGEEGCCMKLVSVRKLDLAQFMKLFQFDGEMSGFAFVQWQSAASFAFCFRAQEFSASNLEGDALRVSKLSSGGLPSPCARHSELRSSRTEQESL